MAPAASTQPAYAKDEKVLCFHHELLYEAKVTDVRPLNANEKKGPLQYRVHYKGWKNTWDDWVPQDRLRKLTDENRELAAHLRKEFDAQMRAKATPRPTPGSKRKAGSDLSSARGSEDRHTSVQASAGPRGQKRGRDMEIEKVCDHSISEQPPAPTFPSAPSTLDSSPAATGDTKPSKTTKGRGKKDKMSQATKVRPARKKRTHVEHLGYDEDPYEVKSRIHKHQKLDYIDQYDRDNVLLAYFYDGMHPDLKLVTAGYVKHQSIHPLRAKKCSNKKRKQEESFHQRPSVRIVVPDHLKAILVDDWENVTKNLQLVHLPSKNPVNTIMDQYFDEEKGKRRLGSAEADILEEVVAGVKEYFDKCLGRILLYRFEREQFFEIRQTWEAGAGEWEGKGPGDVYGAEHLCRLFVSMPELIAQTNMDQQSVNRLREELSKMTQWLGKNSGRFFSNEYENASQEYIEKARGI